MLPLIEFCSTGRAMDGQDLEGAQRKILSYYEQLTKAKNPRRGAVLDVESLLSTLTKPFSLICGSWSRDDVFSFRQALIDVVAHWDDISSAPCPIYFTEHELELHRQEMEPVEELKLTMHHLKAEHGISMGGMVRPEHYECERDQRTVQGDFCVTR